MPPQVAGSSLLEVPSISIAGAWPRVGLGESRARGAQRGTGGSQKPDTSCGKGSRGAQEVPTFVSERNGAQRKMRVEKFKAGTWVEVRNKEEILKTLVENGELDGMPFMPEM